MRLRDAVSWLAPPFGLDEPEPPQRGYSLIGDRSWIGIVIGWRPRYIAWTGFLALAAFLLILAASWASPGWAHAFIHSQGWALVVATAWVLAWGAWSDQRLFDLHKRVQPALAAPLEPTDVDRWHDHFYNVPRDVSVGLGVSALFIWLIVAQSKLWRARFTNWGAHQHVAEVLLACWVGLGGFVVVTMLYGLWNYLSFAAWVLRQPLWPNLHRARACLQELTAFGLATGFGWSVAVALFADIAVRNGHAIAFTVAAALASLGFALIVAPQFLAHQALITARNKQIETARTSQEIEALASLRTWIQSPVDALLFIAQIAAAVGAIAAAA